MAEMTRVLGRMQLDTEGGLVPGSGTEGLVSSVQRRRSRLVKDDSATVGATKAGHKMAVARNKAAVGSFTGEIGVTKAEAVGSFTGEIGVTKAELGDKEAAGSFTGEIGITKAELGNKEAACSFTGEIGITNAVLGNKEAAGSFTGEICITKAEVVNKEASGSMTGEIGVTKEATGPGVVTEKTWIEFVFPIKETEPACVARLIKAEPRGALITKEMVPDSFMDKLKARRLFRRRSPLRNSTGVYDKFPEIRDILLANIATWNYCIDLHEDVLRQDAEKGFAEVGVDFSDGMKKLFILK